jgi:hypothetical protein
VATSYLNLRSPLVPASIAALLSRIETWAIGKMCVNAEEASRRIASSTERFEHEEAASHQKRECHALALSIN